MKILIKYFDLMSSEIRSKFFLLILLFFADLLELVGLAMIIPIINIIIEPRIYMKYLKNIIPKFLLKTLKDLNLLH